MKRIILLFLTLTILILTCEKEMISIKPKVEEKPMLSGQVVEQQNGTPIAGAVVKLLINQVADTTDSAGNFQLEGLSPGADTLFVAVPGYLVLRQVVQIKKDNQPVILSLMSVLTRVTLQNQTEHSGIMVELVEPDTFTVTDSTGKFLFKDIPDGEYTVKAGYPYFAFAECSVMVQGGSIQTPVDIELQQLLQFWVEPAETTFSRSNPGDPYYFSLSGLRLYAHNITNEPVTVGTYLEPLILWALVPQGFEWPYVPNPDNRPEFCFEHYGWLGAEDAIIWFSFTFQPGYTLVTSVPGSRNTVLKDCVIPDEYLFYASINDLRHYPEYFYAAYFWTDSLPHPQPYNQLNKTLFLKRELFNPVTIYITQ